MKIHALHAWLTAFREGLANGEYDADPATYWDRPARTLRR